MSATSTVRPKRAMLALALGGFGIGTTEFVAMGLLPEIATGLGVSEPTAGHVISAYALGVVVGAPLIAALTARVPRKVLLVALMVAFTIGNAATVFAPGYGALMAARFVAGLPHGAYFGVAALGPRTSLAPAGKRARAVALVMLGLSVANVVGRARAASWLGQTVRLAQRLRHRRRDRRGHDRRALAMGAGAAGMRRRNPAHRTRRAAPQPGVDDPRVGTVGFGGMFAVYTYISHDPHRRGRSVRGAGADGADDLRRSAWSSGNLLGG